MSNLKSLQAITGTPDTLKEAVHNGFVEGMTMGVFNLDRIEGVLYSHAKDIVANKVGVWILHPNPEIAQAFKDFYDSLIKGRKRGE